jgi:signal transduction histidine kinase
MALSDLRLMHRAVAGARLVHVLGRLRAGWWVRGWKLAATAVGSELLIVGASALADRAQPGARALDTVGYTLLAVGAAAMPIGLRWPLPALVLALASTSVFYSLGYVSSSPVFVSVLGVLFLGATPSRPWRSALMGLLAIAVVAGQHLLTAGTAGLNVSLLANSGWIAAAILAGYAVTAHQESLAAIRERAQRAEETRELEARRRVTEERLRIARELHDVVSHTISVINVQAGVAAHVMDQRPEQARAALNTITDASREALRELRSILAVLRQVDEDEARSPTPRLTDLETLLRATRQAGMPVGLSVRGDARPLTPPVELAAYRIVQESLTNALRYALGGSAEVTLNFEQGQLTVDVSNTGKPAAEPIAGRGQGIMGMRERAATLGGTLEVGPQPEGGFRVRARLPAPA